MCKKEQGDLCLYFIKNFIETELFTIKQGISVSKVKISEISTYLSKISTKHKTFGNLSQELSFQESPDRIN